MQSRYYDTGLGQSLCVQLVSPVYFSNSPVSEDNEVAEIRNSSLTSSFTSETDPDKKKDKKDKKSKSSLLGLFRLVCQSVNRSVNRSVNQ